MQKITPFVVATLLFYGLMAFDLDSFNRSLLQILDVSDQKLTFMINVPFMVRYSRFQHSRESLRHVKENVEPIKNLNQLFEPFLEKNCLVVVNSFKTMDLSQLTIPVVARKIKPVAVVDNEKIWNIMWA